METNHLLSLFFSSFPIKLKFQFNSTKQNSGEVLLEQKRFEDAVEKFEAAIEREKNRPAPINVLPLVNKALAVLQWRNDLAAAEALVQDALEKDPECAPAVATLAQICLQRGETERAQTLFERHVELVRTEPEIVSSLQFMHVSVSFFPWLR